MSNSLHTGKEEDIQLSIKSLSQVQMWLLLPVLSSLLRVQAAGRVSGSPGRSCHAS